MALRRYLMPCVKTNKILRKLVFLAEDKLTACTANIYALTFSAFALISAIFEVSREKL